MERQREDGDGREARRLAQGARAEAQVLEQALPGGPTPEFGAGVLDHGLVAKLTLCHVSRLLFGNTPLPQLARPQFDVQAHFLVEILGELIAFEEMEQSTE
jgi:hypothetical protein